MAEIAKVTERRIAKALQELGYVVASIDPNAGVLCYTDAGMLLCTIFGDHAALRVSNQHIEMPLAREKLLELYAWLAEFNRQSTFAIGTAYVEHEFDIAFPDFSYVISIGQGVSDAQLTAWISLCVSEQLEGLRALLKHFVPTVA
ncbi:MAG: YbjN domain-containing protein [Corynebacterium sp.]|nr:YbjN domain-containing protein [Corynebacterium sp.]